MKLYICHNELEKKYLYQNGIKHSASGKDPITREKYWVYIKTDYVNKLINKNKMEE